MDRQRKTPSLDVAAATTDLMEYIVGHSELDPRCFYITVSHLYQYVLGLDRSIPVSYTHLDVYKRQSGQYAKYFITNGQ